MSDDLLVIRPGVVSAGLIETIKIDYHGSKVPIWGVAKVSQGKGIVVTPYDPSICGVIQKTLESGGHNCYICKNVVMVNLPRFATSADKDRAVAQVHKLEEDTKIVLRNIRKKARQQLSGSEDEVRKADKELQALTDAYVSKAATIAANKVKTL